MKHTPGTSHGASRAVLIAVMLLLLVPALAPGSPSTPVGEAAGQVVTVTDLGDSATDTGSLRNAVLSATSGTTINFAPNLTGVISLTAPLTISTDLTIVGPGATTPITLDGQGSTGVLDVTCCTVAISGLTIAHGQAPQGGGILNEGTLSL